MSRVPRVFGPAPRPHHLLAADSSRAPLAGGKGTGLFKFKGGGREKNGGKKGKRIEGRTRKKRKGEEEKKT